VITNRYKLGAWIDPTPRHADREFPKKTADQIFDREKDPQELVNLAGKSEYAAVEARLRAYLAEGGARGPHRKASRRLPPSLPKRSRKLRNPDSAPLAVFE
jgi:hypothetical protein